MEFLDELRGYGLPATPHVECFAVVRRRRRALRGADRAAARAGFRDRRPGAEGEPLRPARAAGQHLEEPALGDRLQVREVRGHHAAERHPRAGGQDRRDHARGRPGAGRAGRHDRQPRQPAQRRRDRAQGRPRRRRGGGREGRQDHPAHRPRGKAPAQGLAAEVRLSHATAPSAARSWSRTRAASTSAARTSSARPSSRSASATSPAATRWTSKGWATSWSINWSNRGLVHELRRPVPARRSNSSPNLERMGRKSVGEPAGRASRPARIAGLARLLNALSIRHVGARVAAVLAEHFGSMDALHGGRASSELSEINEIGPIIAAERLRLPAQQVRPRDDRRPEERGREDGVAPRRAARRAARWRARRWSSPARWRSTAATRSRS